MTKALQQLLEEGHTVDMEALSTLSPYRTEHINRFGNYVINPNRMQCLDGFAAWVKTYPLRPIVAVSTMGGPAASSEVV
jgi:hypothetical protein